MPFRIQVQEIMLPLSLYAVVNDDATLLDALHALDAAQAKLQEGMQKHRAVLVRNRKGEFVGKLGYHAFLQALLPHHRAAFEQSVVQRANIDEELVSRAMDAMEMLESETMDLCELAAHIKVRDVCVPGTINIAEDASLMEALRLMNKHNTLSLLVTRQGNVTGILRLSDVFDTVCENLRECERNNHHES